jgi:hypothetical protein
MKLAVKRDFPWGKFTLLFFMYLDDATFNKLPPESDLEKRWEAVMALPGHRVELTHNWEHAPDFPGYKVCMLR